MAHELGSGTLYNFNLTLKYISAGKPVDLEEFKKRLVSSLKAPITSEESDAGKKQEDIREVTVFVTVDDKGNTKTACFRKKFAKGKLVEYTAKMVDGKVRLVGKSALSAEQEKKLFTQLLKETQKASPFDDLGEIGKNVHNAVSELAPELGIKKKR